MVALIGKSALTPRSPFAVPPVNPLHPTSVDMAPRNPLNISTWQSFASTAVPPRDPNNNADWRTTAAKRTKTVNRRLSENQTKTNRSLLHGIHPATVAALPDSDGSEGPRPPHRVAG